MSQSLTNNGEDQCCLLTANIACHENGIPKNLPVKLTVCKKKCPSKSKYIEYLYETIYYTLLSFASFQILHEYNSQTSALKEESNASFDGLVKEFGGISTSSGTQQLKPMKA